jgi:hypothetical protein
MMKNEQEKQKQADEKMLKKFAEAFWKLRSKYPEVQVWGDRDGDVEAIVYRGWASTDPRVYLTRH